MVRRAAIVGGIHHHDPYRGGTIRALPRIADEPHDGPVSLLVYVDRYPPMVNAGAEWMLHAMLRDSVRRGHRVVVATGCVREPTSVEGVEVVPAAQGQKLAAGADAILTHLLWTNEAIRLAAAHDLPLLYIVHNDSQIRYWKLSAAKVSAYVWNSEWVAATCSAFSEAAGVPGTVVRPPLIAADYAVASPAPADREFVTIVNPIEAKGSELFYRLAEAMPGRRFLAVEGAYGSQMRPKSRHRNVVWQPQTGAFRDDVLARTRVLLVGSSYESWGRVAVEACAAGVPSIATPTPGLQEALGDGWPLFAPFGDLAAWTRRLEALDDPALYARVSGEALARAGELDALARLDLDRWDTLLRMAARTTIDRMTGHDPFRPHSTSDSVPSDEGAEEEPAATGGVPEIAREVADWIAAVDGDEAIERAEAAWAIETSRKGGIRKSVADAVARAQEAPGEPESAAVPVEGESEPEPAGGQEAAQEPALAGS